jgi:hypothetical protein
MCLQRGLDKHPKQDVGLSLVEIALHSPLSCDLCALVLLELIWFVHKNFSKTG